MAPARLAASRTGAIGPSVEAAALVVARDLLERAVQVDRLVPAGPAQQGEEALRLAERIDAHQVGAIGEQLDRANEPGDLDLGRTVAEHRQAERRLGDEQVASHRLERRAGGIGDVLVVARRDRAQAFGLDRDLRRAEHVAGGMQRDTHAADAHALAVRRRLLRAGEALAVPQPHQVEGLAGGEHRTVAGTGVVGVGVGDHRPVHRPGRIDVEPAGLAAHAGRRRQQDLVGAHGGQIGCGRRCE